MNNTKLGVAVALAGFGAFASVMAAGSASADPSGAPTFRQLAGVGSDTTQDVMNGLADSITISGTKVLGSYNATGGGNIQTKASGCTIARPNGSGAGRAALLTSLNANGGAGDGCLDFSRSSSLTLTASSPSLTYIPFGVDSISYAVTSGSAVSRGLALSDLQSYYHCDPNFVGTGPNYAVTPILPQAGSGTRKYWEGKMGITDADVNNNVYPCIINGVKNGQIIEEHSGTALDDKAIAPFSIGQYTAQANGLVADKRGRALLGSIDGTIPQLVNGSFSLRRDVYNVIPTSKVGVAPWSTVFVGAGSLVCQQTAIINQYGFASNPNCGDTSNHS